VLRAFCFLLCIPSGGALLTHVYGILPMYIAGWGISLPCCLALVWFAWRGKPAVAEAILVGAFAGFVGTILYDVARIPALLSGRRVFAPIELYGVWLWNADISSRFTEITGWAYHFSNGITFGIMYSLFMRGRHWFWAILWAMVLETIFVVSPLAASVALFYGVMSVVIAYFGHFFYGIGLGWLVHRWDYTMAQLRLLEPVHKWILAGVPVVLCAAYFWSPAQVAMDTRAKPGLLSVEGSRLNPDWVRLRTGTTVRIQNPEKEAVRITIPLMKQEFSLLAGQSVDYTFPLPSGRFEIYQVLKQNPVRSRSSFVVVEPARPQR
jgi:hypothetical protein